MRMVFQMLRVCVFVTALSSILSGQPISASCESLDCWENKAWRFGGWVGNQAIEFQDDQAFDGYFVFGTFNNKSVAGTEVDNYFRTRGAMAWACSPKWPDVEPPTSMGGTAGEWVMCDLVVCVSPPPTP